MSLKPILIDALEAWDWDDPVQTDEDGTRHRVATNYELDGAVYRLFVEAHDDVALLKVYAYALFVVPEARHVEACVLLNRLNKNVYAGHFDLAGDRVRYVHVVDVENCPTSPQILTNMLLSATRALYPPRMRAVEALALTERSVADIVREYEEAGD